MRTIDSTNFPATLALATSELEPAGVSRLDEAEAKPTIETPDPKRARPEASTNETDEISAREAARILGLKPETVRGYIRSARLPGHYDHTPGRTGWVTHLAAVDSYRAGLQSNG